MISSLSFYFYIVICFAGALLQGQAPESLIMQKQISDQKILQMYTTLRVITRIHRDIADQNNLEDQFEKHDFLIEIMAILMETYQKIIAATVTHYLMIHTPMQQDLQTTIIRIIAGDMIQVFAILGKHLLHFVVSDAVTLQQKLFYCIWFTCIIAMIRIGVDQIPKPGPNSQASKTTTNQISMPSMTEQFSYQFHQNISNQNQNRPDQSFHSQEIQEDKSSCLTEKFSNWS